MKVFYICISPELSCLELVILEWDPVQLHTNFVNSNKPLHILSWTAHYIAHKFIKYTLI